MQTFQAVCAKNNRKIELVVRYNSLEEARVDLHAQGYSIIDIKQIEERETIGQVFYFEILLDGKKKSGQIQSGDLFKAYIKLVDDLRYTVTAIYEDINASPEEKAFVTSKIQASYLLYKQQNTKKEGVKEVKIEQTIQKSNDASDISLSYVGKEIRAYYGLIDRILLKIEMLLTKYSTEISNERKWKLQEIHTTLKQLKNTTNTDKLRIISEKALLRIWAVELELVAGTADKEKQGFINETNDLLKKFGSSERVRNPDTDILLKGKRILDEFIQNFSSIKEIKKEWKKDTQSFVFYKNLRELHIYKQKLRETNKGLIVATILFQKEKQQRLWLKKRLIVQNIQLIENRIKNIRFSYSKIVKGIHYYTDIGIFSLSYIGDILLYGIFFYSVFFIFSQMSHTFPLNYSILYPIVLFSFFSFLTKVMKNIPSVVIFFLLYGVFFLFLQINF
ncbi:MAG: hypothetical protein ACD_71C00077G0003 [uncultured bacterium (gcode 4)]|uniref:Uncharacterized protein n=1 Tax=uncultured bacterium (gcode 4) TaxID=1234023 RepID=K1Z5Y6_9BACT|nr:MAG: hypothetical protein ACD_71C00077G0003 [uncultured bacterium (gcode 4)]